jgi:hypothetical protein
MMTLKEFLQEQAEYLRPQEAAKEEMKKEWIAAVERLLAQMTVWLKDSDQEKILNLQTKLVERSESALGTYQIPALTIWLGSRVVEVEPVACAVIGPGVHRPGDGQFRGRVDLLGRPDRYILYRFVDSQDRESWLMIDDQTFKSQPFSREAFEAALVSLFG